MTIAWHVFFFGFCCSSFNQSQEIRWKPLVQLRDVTFPSHQFPIATGSICWHHRCDQTLALAGICTMTTVLIVEGFWQQGWITMRRTSWEEEEVIKIDYRVSDFRRMIHLDQLQEAFKIVRESWVSREFLFYTDFRQGSMNGKGYVLVGRCGQFGIWDVNISPNMNFHDSIWRAGIVPRGSQLAYWQYTNSCIGKKKLKLSQNLW